MLKNAFSRSWILPAVLGLATMIITRFVASDWTPIPQFHDEAAYVLQSEIFASGRWSTPPPPDPAFFEQTHVLLDPVLASKYPPGHSLLLALGALVGWVGIVPFLLSGITGALVYSLAARVAAPGVGLLTWGLWTVSPENLHWRASFFSELTTSMLLLASWWLLMRWRERPRPAPLALLAAAVAWGAITRPWTMLALAVPIGWVVLRRVRALRCWGQLSMAAAVGAAVLLVWPLWSQATLGSLDPTPHSLYTERYIPWDQLGFGLDDQAPTRPESAEIAAISGEFTELHREHTPGRLPLILAQRVRHLVKLDVTSWRTALLVLAAIGLFAHWRRALFPAASAFALLLAYLLYAHPAHWALYYLEILPVGPFLVALGGWQVMRWLDRVGGGSRFDRAKILAVVVFVGLLIPPSVTGVVRQRAFEGLTRRNLARFERCMTAVPRPAGVFVRHADDHDPHRSYVRNVPDIAAAPVVVALDRGVTNARLVEELPGRTWYTLDESTWTFAPWDARGTGSEPVQCPEL